MKEPDPQEAAVFLDVQLLGDIQRVVVAVPGEKSALAQTSRKLKGSESLNAHRDGRTAVVKSLRIGNPVYLQARNGFHPQQQALAQAALVPHDLFIGGEDGGPARCNCRFDPCPDICDVPAASRDARDALVVERPPLPAIR